MRSFTQVAFTAQYLDIIQPSGRMISVLVCVQPNTRLQIRKFFGRSDYALTVQRH